jgi:UDP-GlcNAc:undecaprenyl-phosphate GlcNAc-1-phosphate transferase
VVAYSLCFVFVALVMASLRGAVGRVLFCDCNPAGIFMADSGSCILSFVLAMSSFAPAVQKASIAVALVVPMLALGVPAVGTLLSIWRCALERCPVFCPERGQVRHRLPDTGLTHCQVVLLRLARATITPMLSSLERALPRRAQAQTGEASPPPTQEAAYTPARGGRVS